MEENEKSPKDRVKEKFNIAADLKKSKMKPSIGNVEMSDGKVTARFEISGIPRTGEPGEYSSSYKSFSKIFDSFEDFSEYGSSFFNMSEADILKLCKGMK